MTDATTIAALARQMIDEAERGEQAAPALALPRGKGRQEETVLE